MATAQHRSTDIHQLPLRQPQGPDIAACSTSLARRPTFSTGLDIGSDYLPMIVDIGTTAARPSRISEAGLAHHKADWQAFQEDCEAVLTGAEPARIVREATALLLGPSNWHDRTAQLYELRCRPVAALENFRELWCCSNIILY